jgi:hypothetical protein
MATRTAFWPDVRRAGAQWFGVALASVLSGLLLGTLQYQGIAEKLALEIAVPPGLLLALWFWIVASHRFPTVIIVDPVPEYAVATSSTAVQFQGGCEPAYLPTAAFATAVLIVVLSSAPTPAQQQAVSPMACYVG